MIITSLTSQPITSSVRYSKEADQIDVLKSRLGCANCCKACSNLSPSVLELIPIIELRLSILSRWLLTRSAVTCLLRSWNTCRIWPSSFSPCSSPIYVTTPLPTASSTGSIRCLSLTDRLDISAPSWCPYRSRLPGTGGLIAP